MAGSRLIFRQLFEHVSSTYTYVLGCPATKEAVLIDPVIETISRDLQLLQQLGLKLLYAANTHVHADHVTGSGEIKQLLPGCRSVLLANSGGKADLLVKSGETLRVGKVDVELRATPGHTDGCLTYVCHDGRMAFTADSLLIRGCGRTDFQQAFKHPIITSVSGGTSASEGGQNMTSGTSLIDSRDNRHLGDPGMLYDSVHSQILSLPEDYLLFPGHDYKGLTATSVQEELKHNPRLTKSKGEFVTIMNNLGLPYPKQIHKAVPANIVDGVLDEMDEGLRKTVLQTLSPELLKKLGKRWNDILVP